ncbi:MULTISPECIES: DUF2884 family protein [Gammaproteobacteria]|uniref:DUF2884 family protein n=1 Tax=Gammaproteobacteria TaxID=1236 RepID=UPI000DD0A414|nr:MULTISPECIES: DUF2884 family protein [Gammaproteobacteria]RTE85579.1 DUF2884 family protein [Aliidiomarina sp. B3213]TCZ89549.1 DUF2884 family protein [Lysobacter sp. N42]
MSVLAVGLLASSVVIGDTNLNVGQECKISVDHELHVSSEQVRLIDDGHEMWRIDAQGDLYVEGVYSAQPDNIQEMLVDYKEGVERQTEAVVYVMGEALEITSEALVSVFSEMFSADHRIVQRIEDLHDTLEVEFDSVVYQENGETIVRGQELESFGDRLGDTIEQEVEEIVSSSVGSLLVMVGRELIKGGGDMSDFEQRMENMGADLEARIEERTVRIEERADQMCDEIIVLNQIESELAMHIPVIANYPLFEQAQSK